MSAVAAWRRGNPAGCAWSRPQDDGAIGRCLRERRPVLVTTPTRPATPDCARGCARSSPSRSTSGPELWGALDLRSAEPGAFGERRRAARRRPSPTTSAPRCAPPTSTAGSTRPTSGTAEALAAALEAKDDYTADHARSIADLAVEVGRELDLDEEHLRDLRYGAIFHDIGKIAIPDAILNKPGPLTRRGARGRWRRTRSSASRSSLRSRSSPACGGSSATTTSAGTAPATRTACAARRSRSARASSSSWTPTTRWSRTARTARAMRRRGGPRGAARHAGTQFDPGVVDAFLRVLDRRGAMAGDLI